MAADRSGSCSTASGTAVAQSTAKPLRVYLTQLHCVQESDGGYPVDLIPGFKGYDSLYTLTFRLE
jgi:hypothetical protein